jgi:predicted acylesterase/phospholipase RssA
VNTSRWLKDSSADGVFHVRRAHSSDLTRLARSLSGRAVSVVLGGGGARGFAHLGVLRALGELGVPVDILGGTSIGAAMAYAAAQGHSPEVAQGIVKRGFRRLLDFTLPIASVLAGRRITAVIDKHCGDWDIEDLWVPFFCVSTNLTRGSTRVHRRGNLMRYAPASRFPVCFRRFQMGETYSLTEVY